MRWESPRTRAAAIIAIIGLAAFFRFFLITELPPGLYPDEAANGNNAAEAVRTLDFKIFYPENNGREGLFINLQAAAVAALGAEPWVLRMVSAVFGTLTVLGIYLLTKELFHPAISKPETLISKQSQNPKDQNRFRDSRGEAMALLSAFLLATSYWHINFSRIGFRAILVPFFAVFGTYWLLKAIRTENVVSAIAAGIAIGLGFHTYIAFRFMPLVLAVPVVLALRSWWIGSRPQRCVPCVVALVLFVTLTTALPIGFYFLGHPQDFVGRSGQVSIFSAHSPAREFLKSTTLTLGMFNIQGDCNPRHNLSCQRQLFWPVGILFLIGLCITIRDLLRRPLSPVPYTLSAWFLFMMLPATLTREGLPHALRSICLIPPVMIFAALGGWRLWQNAVGYIDRAMKSPRYAQCRGQLRRIRNELTLAAILLLIWIPVATYRDYFVRFANAQATQDAFAADLWFAGQYLTRLPAGVQKFVIVNLSGDDIRGVPAPAQTVMFATDTFGEAGRRTQHVIYVTRPEDIAVEPGHAAVIVPLNPKDETLLEAVWRQFPDLEERTVGDIKTFWIQRKAS